MTYQLARQLQDAGFPENPVGRLGTINAIEFMNGSEPSLVYRPTLSELITAVEPELIGLYINYPQEKWPAFKWVADGSLKRGATTGVGSTPEEAVADLWLKLHSKQ